MLQMCPFHFGCSSFDWIIITYIFSLLYVPFIFENEYFSYLPLQTKEVWEECNFWNDTEKEGREEDGRESSCEGMMMCKSWIEFTKEGDGTLIQTVASANNVPFSFLFEST